MTARALVWILAAGGPLWSQCLDVAGERILARDLARAVPAFSSLPGELPVGFAPSAGARRQYGHAELERLARRYGVELSPEAAACFVRRLDLLTPQRMTEALAAALPGAQIEIVDYSRQPTPAGALRFPLSGLETAHSSGTAQLWRGYVAPAGGDDFPVWVKVRIRQPGQQVFAVQALPAGKPITREQLRLEDNEGPGLGPDIDQIVGKIPRRSISAGAPVRLEWLAEAPEVERGQKVRVEVVSGLAHLRLEAQAQSTGRRGETIALRNPGTGKIFRGRVMGRGWVAVEGVVP